MTISEAKKFKEAHPYAVDLTKESHFRELSPLVEVHVEVTKVRKDECHEMWSPKQSTYMPKDFVICRIGEAAGISFPPRVDVTRKEGPACWVGTSQGMRMSPDGNYELGDVCEYEWDADIRTEEAKINGKTEWKNKQKTTREYTEKELAKTRIEFMKFGRQRANTGARARAITSMLGMPRGFAGLFEKNDSPDSEVEFLTSRIIINSKNKMVLQAAANSLTGGVRALYGGNVAQQQIEAPNVDDAALMDVTQWEEVPEDEFPEIDEQPSNERQDLVVSLEGFLESGSLPGKGKQIVQSALDDLENQSIDDLKNLVKRCEKYAGAA